MEAVKQAGATEPKGKRHVHRSPNYPVLTLGEALEKAALIYGVEKRAFARVNVLAQDLGYTPGTGPANRAISALRQYGLLEEKGGEFGLTDSAFNLLHLSDSPEREALLREAGKKPPLIADVLAKYKSVLPSDTGLKDYLVKDKKFNPTSVEQFVQMFRKTVKLAHLDPSGDNNALDLSVFPNVEAVPQTEKADSRSPSAPNVNPLAQPSAPLAAEIPYFRFTLKGATVEFRASAPLAPEHFALIKAHLKAYEPQVNDLVPSISSAPQKVKEPTPEAPAVNKTGHVLGSLMITQAQKAQLRTLGHTDEAIAKMKPTEAHRILGLTAQETT